MLSYAMLCYVVVNSTVAVQLCAILFYLSKCVCGEKEREVEYILHFGYMFISTKSFTTVVSVSVAQGDSMG